MKFRLIISLTLLASIWSCNPTPVGTYQSVQGFAQGTSYHITYQSAIDTDIKEQIDSLLKQFDASLSSYDSTSIISGINRNSADTQFEIPNLLS